MSSFNGLIAATVAPALAVTRWSDYLVPVLAILIVVLTILFGWRDVKRFSFRRVRAIAGVCFRESVRRRVLWVVPLAIIGVIAVTSLTRPFDAQDAVRQTTKYSVFASGLIVVIAAIILACTNLPKEIESRVIFTIVTKPTTRLEIVSGKVLGFAGISLLILLIMGLFTAGYSYMRAWKLESGLRRTLASDVVLTNAERDRLTEYVEAGLLDTKAVRPPDDLQIYAKLPTGDGIRWFSGNLNVMTVPFALTPDEKLQLEQAIQDGAQPAFIITLRVADKPVLAEYEKDALAGGTHPVEGGEGLGPFLNNKPLPQIRVAAHGQKSFRLLAQEMFQAPVGAIRDSAWQSGGDRVFYMPLTDPEGIAELLEEERFNLEVTGFTPGLLYGAGDTPVQLVATKADTPQPVVSISSSKDIATDSLAGYPAGMEYHSAPGPRFSARYGRAGMQLEGQPESEGEGLTAVFSFRDVNNIEPEDGLVTLQSNVIVDRAGDLDAGEVKASVIAVSVINRTTGKQTPPALLALDAARQADVRLPADAFAGGNFDVTVRGLTAGQFLGINGVESGNPSIVLVRAHTPFLFNLFKGLSVLWMLSVLVVAIAVFCSTFLSWPIAIVLTVLLLLGRWGVDQLGDSVSAGSSRSWVGDLFGVKDPGKNQAVVESMEVLTAVLRNAALVLPDVSQFPVIEDLDRGVSMPADKVWRAAYELLLYGLPLILLTYIVFRNKEVAP